MSRIENGEWKTHTKTRRKPSRIDQLIAELCPEGVEYKPLGEIGEWYGGGTPSKSRIDYWNNGTIPWVSPKDMRRPIIVDTEDYISEAAVRGSATRLVPAYSVAVVVRSSILDRVLPTALIPVPVALNQDMKAVVAGDGIIPAFVAHVLRSRGPEILRVARKTGGSVASIESRRLFAFPIPVPPLEVQREIVKVLDTFTQLEAELEAELEARRRQYQYYRDALLSFEDDASLEGANARSVRWTTLGEVAEAIRTGLNPRQNFKLNPPGATNYYVTVRELDGFGIRISEKTDRVDDAGLALIQKRSRIQAGDVLFSGTGTIGRTALVEEVRSDWNVKEGVYVITLDPRQIDPRFAIHLFHSGDVRNQIMSRSDGSTVVSIPMASLREIKIPLPSLDEQARIVAILDRFDALVNDLSSGLPAEIAGRRRQYEHYRDRLLTFKEKV